MKEKGRMKDMTPEEAREQYFFAYWPLVYRFTEEMAMATNSLGVEISSEVL